MAYEAAPFDVVEASRRVWLDRWTAGSASGMATFTAILRSFQLLNEQVNVVMREHGLTFVRYQVLSWLATDPESPPTLSWISRTLRIPPATVTNIIDDLEAEKLIKRRSHPSDGRTTSAVITARGREMADAMTKELNTAVYEQIPLSEGKRTKLIDLLCELRARGGEFDVDRSQQVVDEVVRGA